MFFDRKDLLAGIGVVLAAFGSVAHHDGGVHCLLSTSRDVVVIDFVIVVLCLVGGSIASSCLRGKLHPNHPE